MLNAFMNIKEVEVPDYDIRCIILGMMFAASATTASLLPWVLKYLHDFPEVRQRVQVNFAVLQLDCWIFHYLQESD
jgi:cytochrome P450